MRLLTLAFLILGAMCAMAASAGDPDSLTHDVAGFSVPVPAGWSIQMQRDGFEFGKGDARILVARLGVVEGKSADILALFTATDRKKSAASVEKTAPIDKPYPGLRAVLQGKRYLGEAVVLETPHGFHLLSIEQAEIQPENQQAFESLLLGFRLLATPPFPPHLNLRQTVQLGPIELMLPEGDADKQPGYVVWRSRAAGLLVAETIRQPKAQQVRGDALKEWERDFVNAAGGLPARVTQREMRIGEREVMLADYEGARMQARVEVSAIGPDQLLRLALISRKEAFASHRPVLDAVSLSVIEVAPPRAMPSVTSREVRTAARARPDRAQEPAATAAPPKAVETGWQEQLRTELRRCDSLSFFEKVMCREKARWKYCDGRWNSVPECEVAGK